MIVQNQTSTASVSRANHTGEQTLSGEKQCFFDAMAQEATNMNEELKLLLKTEDKGWNDFIFMCKF